MTERETLLAEIAALWTVRKIAPDNEFIEATLEQRQARLAEIDAEPEPDWQAWKPLVREIISMYHTTRLADADVAAHILGKPSVRALIAAFAKAPPMGECQPRWPSEAELREMADVSSQSKYSPYAVALEMARRIRAYQTEEQP